MKLLALALCTSSLLAACETHKASPPPRGTAKPSEPAANPSPTPAAPTPPGDTPPAAPAPGPDPTCDVVAQQLLTIHSKRVEAAPAGERDRLKQEIGQLVATQKVECAQKKWPAEYKRCVVAAQDDGALGACDKLRGPAAPPAGPVTDANAPDCAAVALHYVQIQRQYLGELVSGGKLAPEQQAQVEKQIAGIDKDRNASVDKAAQQCATMGFSPALRNCIAQTKNMQEYRMCIATQMKPGGGAAPAAPAAAPPAAPVVPPGGSQQPGHEGHNHP